MRARVRATGFDLHSTFLLYSNVRINVPGERTHVGVPPSRPLKNLNHPLAMVFISHSLISFGHDATGLDLKCRVAAVSTPRASVGQFDQTELEQEGGGRGRGQGVGAEPLILPSSASLPQPSKPLLTALIFHVRATVLQFSACLCFSCCVSDCLHF